MDEFILDDFADCLISDTDVEEIMEVESGILSELSEVLDDMVEGELEHLENSDPELYKKLEIEYVDDIDELDYDSDYEEDY